MASLRDKVDGVRRDRRRKMKSRDQKTDELLRKLDLQAALQTAHGIKVRVQANNELSEDEMQLLYDLCLTCKWLDNEFFNKD